MIKELSNCRPTRDRKNVFFVTVTWPLHVDSYWPQLYSRIISDFGHVSVLEPASHVWMFSVIVNLNVFEHKFISYNILVAFVYCWCLFCMIAVLLLLLGLFYVYLPIASQ